MHFSSRLIFVVHVELFVLHFTCSSRFIEISFFFFFNDPPTTEIYTLSLHDALPIRAATRSPASATGTEYWFWRTVTSALDRKSTRLNSSHTVISYAVFCLKKKKKKKKLHKKKSTKSNTD